MGALSADAAGIFTILKELWMTLPSFRRTPGDDFKTLSASQLRRSLSDFYFLTYFFKPFGADFSAVTLPW